MEKLIEKLSPLMKLSLEEAAQLAVSQGHFNIEIEHWVLAISKHPHTDLLELIKKSPDSDEGILINQLVNTVHDFQSGNTRSPAFSKNLLEALNDAWLVSSVEFDRQDITSGHLLIAVLKHGGLLHQLGRSCPEFYKLSVNEIERLADKVIGSTSESAVLAEAGANTIQGQNQNIHAAHLLSLIHI